MNATDNIEIIADGDLATMTLDQKCRLKYVPLLKLHNDWIKGNIVLKNDNGFDDHPKISKSDVLQFIDFYNRIDSEFRPRVNTVKTGQNSLYIKSTFLLSVFSSWSDIHNGLDVTESTMMDSIMITLLFVSDEYIKNELIMFGLGYTN